MKTKQDPTLVETIIALKKTNPAVAKELAKPKRRWPAVNLKDIDMVSGDVVVAGKILSAGDLTSGKKLVAWSVSTKALEKIKSANAQYVSLVDELKKNPQLEGLQIIK